MRFLVDAQLPPALARWLRERGHEALTAKDAGLRDSDDTEICAYALTQDAIIVTKDEDFVRLTSAADRPRILWVRIGNSVNRILLARFEDAWAEVETHFAAGARLVELR
jgi:predicted nuclease of predicted toxin-antitoxin system